MWDSIAEIVSEFDLDASPDDRDQVVKELKNRIAEWHPDRTGGDFGGDEDRKRRYHRAVDALTHLRTESTSLVPISEMTALVEQVSSAVRRAAQQPIDQRVSDARDQSMEKSRSRYRAPKISLGAITAALSYVTLFPGELVEHPFFGPYLAGTSGPVIWAAIVGALLHAWVFVSMSERRRGRVIDTLYSLEYQREALRRVSHTKDMKFTRAHFQHSLAHDVLPYSSLGFLLGRIDGATIEKAVDLALERFLERGWISRLKRRSLEDWYRVEVEDIRPHGA